VPEPEPQPVEEANFPALQQLQDQEALLAEQEKIKAVPQAELGYTGTLIVEGEGPHAVQRGRATWLVRDNRPVGPDTRGYAAMTAPDSGAPRSLEAWGEVDATTSLATVEFVLTEFRRTGTYGIPFVAMYDVAGNIGGQEFSESPLHQPLVTLPIATTNPDFTAPEIVQNDDPGAGLHRIQVSAVPTHPEAPNGETLVTIRYQARDDKAGLGSVYFELVDPQGLVHADYHYHPNFYSRFFVGDPTAWTEYELVVVLPVGSPPGIWGLSNLYVADKVDNTRAYRFAETVAFRLDEGAAP
jgi:hypothetical protein